MNFSNTITSEEIQKLPIIKYSGKIVLVDKISIFNNIKKLLLLEKIWGFDTESKPVFISSDAKTRKPALLQLSSETTTYLFRLNKINIPDEIIEIFQNPDILKIGLAIKEDIRNLQKIKKFTPNGFIDLQSMVKKYGISELGLKKLTAITLSHNISKKQQLSNWESDELSQEQIIYAATDSWVTQKIYFKLKDNDSARI